MIFVKMHFLSGNQILIKNNSPKNNRNSKFFPPKIRQFRVEIWVSIKKRIFSKKGFRLMIFEKTIFEEKCNLDHTIFRKNYWIFERTYDINFVMVCYGKVPFLRCYNLQKDSDLFKLICFNWFKKWSRNFSFCTLNIWVVTKKYGTNTHCQLKK